MDLFPGIHHPIPLSHSPLLFSVSLILRSHLILPRLMLWFMLSSLQPSSCTAIGEFPASRWDTRRGPVTRTLCPVVNVSIADYFSSSWLPCWSMFGRRAQRWAHFFYALTLISHCLDTAWPPFNWITSAAMFCRGMYFLQSLVIPYWRGSSKYSPNLSACV